MSELVIGIDGGGTKTAAWLAPLVDVGSGQVLGRGVVGPGNPRAVGFEAAQENIDSAVELAFADAHLTRHSVAGACLALAGAGRPEEQARIAAWATRQQIASKVHVCGDAEPILAAASPDNLGIALIAGTGSLAWGRNATGETARCGGWGYLLGDEGSGYAIALAGLRAAMRAADGRGPETDLLPRYLQELRAQSPDDVVAKIYSPEMTRDRLAALSAIVFEMASTDAVAEAIVWSAVNDLAGLVITLVARLRPSSEQYTIALAGGALVHQPNYRDQVLVGIDLGLIARKLPRPARNVTIEEPVRGCVELARRATRLH